MSNTVALSERLARFREHAAPRGPVERGPDRDEKRVGDHRGDRARRLAGALGGRVLGLPSAPLVVHESSFEIPLSRRRLSELPYACDPNAPLVCLDTETTGLGTGAGTVAFLVGIGTWEGTRYRVRQLFLPEHSEEMQFLSLLETAIPAGALLVTYNGRSFDWPLLVTRYRLHRRAPPQPAGHLDLLPIARQLWRHRLPDARLATVETGVARVHRRDDLPGALIPARYFAFLRTGRPSLLRAVADHNRQDVVSLACLLVELADRLGDGVARRRAHPGDLAGLARAFLRARRSAEALACYDAAVSRDEPSSPAASMSAVGSITSSSAARIAAERAHLLARMGRQREAAAAWLEVAEHGGPLGAVSWIQVAKHREHAERDFGAALLAAQRAASLAELARAFGAPVYAVERDLRVRVPRLRHRRHAASEKRPRSLD